MNLAAHVLVVEDEEALSAALKYNLEKEGYSVSLATDGEEALILAEERKPDLILLDWMLPKAPGIEVCRRLRARQETRNTPIVMLTARTGRSRPYSWPRYRRGRLHHQAGGDAELLARLRAVMRRIRPGLAEDKMRFGDIIVDRVAHRVKRGARDVHLGPHRIQTARSPDPASGPCVQPRTIARRGLGL